MTFWVFFFIFNIRYFIFDLAMTDGFIRKKVESLTLGEKLVKLRSQYRMSLTEIAKATRIQAKYLEALESGDYQSLPAEVYVRGFLRSYARYLGLEDEAFVKLYDKEKHIRTHLGKTEPAKERPKVILGRVWVVTPRTLVWIGIGVVLLGTFGYLLRELNSFVAEPHLIVTSPVSGMTTSEGSLTLIGRTDAGARIMLNGQSVFVNGDGAFQELLTLQPGTNTFQVSATNRFEKTKTVTVVVENTTLPPVVDESPIPVTVGVNRRVEAVRLVADGVVVWNGAWEEGKEESLSVRETLTVTTSDPLATLIRVEDTALQSVGLNSNVTETFEYTPLSLTALKNTNTNSPAE